MTAPPIPPKGGVIRTYNGNKIENVPPFRGAGGLKIIKYPPLGQHP
jgi:hypothetical protein